MKKFVLAMSLLLITAASFSAAQASSITYSINDYPALESGYKVSGSITTDGTIGGLSSGNITAWTWTLANSSGSTVYGTVSSTDSGANLALDGTVTASSTQITMGPAAGLSNDLYLNGGITSLNGQSLIWSRDPENTFFDLLAKDIFQGNYIQQNFYASSNYPPGLTLSSASDWVIATVPAVPEPSTFIVTALGGLGLIVHNRLRRNETIVA